MLIAQLWIVSISSLIIKLKWLTHLSIFFILYFEVSFWNNITYFEDKWKMVSFNNS